MSALDETLGHCSYVISATNPASHDRTERVYREAREELAVLRANRLDLKIVEAVRAYQRTFARGSDFTLLASIAHAEAFARLLSVIAADMKEGNT